MLLGLSQALQAFPIESNNCLYALPDQTAVQECLRRKKEQEKEWEKQMKERDFPAVPQLKDEKIKQPLNCFYRQSTGEQVCAN